MPIVDHFKFLAPFYDRFLGFTDAERLISLVGLPIAGRILDAGGGTGRVAEVLRGYAGQVLVADLSMAMLRRAAAKSLETTCAATEYLPFEDGAFDRVIIVDALHHVADQPRTARELCRLLRPAGRLVIVEPDIDHMVVKLVALVENIFLMRSHFLPADKIQALFKSLPVAVRLERHLTNLFVTIEKER